MNANTSYVSHICIIFYISTDHNLLIGCHYDLVVVVIAHYFLKSIQMCNFQFLTWCSSSTPPTMSNTDEHNNKTQLICKNVAPVCLFLLVLVCGFRARSGLLVFPVLLLVVSCFFLPFLAFPGFPLLFSGCSGLSCFFLGFFWFFLNFPGFSLFSQFFHSFPGLFWMFLIFITFPGFVPGFSVFPAFLVFVVFSVLF